MLSLVWQKEAKTDLFRLHDFIADISPEPAERMVMDVLSAINQLRHMPEMGKPSQNSVQSRELIVPFGARAYVISYKISDDKLVILRIWHGVENRS